jgi:uncharacterized protein YgiB involved in biofilm formation
MKRSRSMVLTTIMASSGLSLAACDSSPPVDSPWLNPPAAQAPAAQAAAAAQSVDGRTYPNLQACRDADIVPNTECETAFAQAEAQAPKFNDRQSCEERYGVDQCVPRSQAGGGSVFMPLLTGFVVGQALSNLGNRGYYGMQAPYGYGDRRYGGGGYYGGGGNRTRDYVTGRPNDRYDAPSRVQSRSSVISRGGFGGGSRSFGG